METGFQSCQSVIMVLHSTRVLSMMPCVFVTTGNHQTYQATVSAAVTDHALTCPTGGFPSVRHNDLRDFTANLLTEVCRNVCIEPPPQALTGELLSHETSNSEDGARLDVSAQGFWGDRHQRTFFDVRVFHPNAPSYRKMQLPSAYCLHERQKPRSYDQRVREIEHGSFTPLVFTTSGGMGKCASVTLASLLSTKQEQNYGATIAWIRCCLSCALPSYA